MATSVTHSEAVNEEADRRDGLPLGEALVTAFVLAVLPYLLVRGPAARIARRLNRRGAPYKAQ